MSLLNRGPKGQFIDSGSALHCWLPVLLDSTFGVEIPEMLERAANWCRFKGGKWLIDGGTQIALEPEDEYAREWLPANYIRVYEKYVATAALLRECAAKVREVWK